MAAELRVAIVGMGIGRPNGRALHAHPRARVTALCDLDAAKMAEFATELGGEVRCFTDFNAMCADGEVDAVFVGTPNQLHVPIALAAVRAGKHVMVTKPLADALSPARELVDAADAAGVVGMMSLSTRFADNVRYLGQRVAAGDLGEVYYARARSIRRSGIPDWSKGFIAEGGGAFRDMGVHYLDAAWWIMGMPEPVSVTGVAGARFGPRGQGYWNYHAVDDDFAAGFKADDYGGGFIRFADGSGLQIESFWASHQPDECNIELFGTEAGARLHPTTLYRTVGGAPQNAEVKLPTGKNPWENIADHFVAACLDGVPCQAPLRHGLIVQQMLEALLTSAQQGGEVRIGG